MSRGGKRSGAGRTPISGKSYKIKIPDETTEQLNLFFPGKTVQEQIRSCLNYALEQKSSKSMDDRRYTVVDLFCGAGGFSRGLMDVGFNVVLGIDHDSAALKTFSKNHEGSEIMDLNLFDHRNLQIAKSYLDEKKIQPDVLIGGPPCQGFSLAGPRKENDERNTLYTAMVKFAKMIKPKVVLLENVPGLATLYDGKAKDRIIEDFSNLGYKMSYKIMFAPEYGIPQTRKRIFFVGVKSSSEDFEFPQPFVDAQHYITSEDAISDLPSLENNLGMEVADYENSPNTEYQQFMRDGSEKIYNHIGTNHEEKTKKLISMIPEGKNYKALPEPYNKMFKYNEALTRYHSKKPSNTINTGHRSHFHYKWNRIPTVRESARLQTFKDTFVFYGNKTEQYRQVGNAVPPLWGLQMGVQVLKVLQNDQKEV